MISKPHYQKLMPSVLFLLMSLSVVAQDELSLDDIPSETVYVKEAFNAPHVIFSQSTNMLQAKRLDVVFGHRFGKLNEGAFNAFGLDQGFIRIGFEYGIKDWLTAGIGRSSWKKDYDFYLKHRPLIQSNGGGKNVPVSVTVFFSTAFSSNELRRQNDILGGDQFVNQLVYTLQPAISRQFSTRFSAQITGSFVHRNSVPSAEYENKVYGVGAGMRLKLTNRIHLLAEYNHMMNNSDEYFNPTAIGFDIVAGGHVFNLHFANSVGIIEKEFLTETKDDFFDGGIRFGFTVRRSFMLEPKVEGGKVKY